MRNMSNLSLSEWNHLLDQEMCSSDAVDYLYHQLPCRSFSEVMKKVYPADDLRARLVDIIADAQTARESADRTVRNWLADRVIPGSREMIFRIAFGLGLSVEDANLLLCAISDYGIHVRDPEEVVYHYALQTGQSYAQAQQLQKECKLQTDARGCKPANTQLLREQVQTLQTNADFVAWYKDHADDFSRFHNTAYGFFTEHLDCLIKGDDDFSIEYIGNICMRFRNAVPLNRKCDKLDDLQRIIKHYWPSVTAIKQMKNRHIDVSRKALLLLYILCDGTTDMNRYDDMDEDYHPPKDYLETHAFQVDAMLKSCGMGLLDPRGAFDWLVMYCMCLHCDEGMSERMEQVIACVFHTETALTSF